MSVVLAVTYPWASASSYLSSQSVADSRCNPHATPRSSDDCNTRGGLLEAIAHYRSKLEAVVFMWVPAHVGIACNAYADAVATAYLGNNYTEDASKVVRDAVRTRLCMYTVRREAAQDTEKREIADRRTYGHMRKSAHDRLGVQAISKDDETGIAHGRGGGTAVERSGCSKPQAPLG